jgi:iron complex outermembrane receptor protein
LTGNTLVIFAGLPNCSAQNLDLTQKSLEDLMNVKVTSVSRKEQTTSQAAAAVFVISRDDIRRSGVANIPDLLRMVPGLDVAQINTSTWAIAVRGFNGQYSEKLLVLVDGRTVYTSTFAGVYWDTQNIPLDTIERIEVIRGPGAAIWGSNAMNGVINIITRSAASTQGGYVVASAGNISTGSETIGYGGKFHGLGAYRVYAEGFHNDSLPTFGGLNGQDDWRLVHGGFRTDSTLSANDSLTIDGETNRGNAGEMSPTISLLPPVTAIVPLRNLYSGWHLLSRWNHALSPRSDTSLQVYFDRTNRGDTTYSSGLLTFDLDFQHHFLWGERQDIVWGVGYRANLLHTSPTVRVLFNPNDSLTQLFSSFAQDEITVVPNRVHLSLSARVEHNDFTGFDFQPSSRLAWTPDSKNMLWSAISIADRTPSSANEHVRVNLAALPGPGNLPVLSGLLGNTNEKNERLTAFELGYRNAWTSKFSVDSTAFYNRYHDAESFEPGIASIETNPAPAHLLIPLYFGNGLHGETHGIELFAEWKVTDYWTLKPGYSFFAMHLHRSANSQDVTDASAYEGGTPDRQAQLRSSLRLPKNLHWNTAAYFVNRLPAVSIPSYTRVDTGLTWQAGERVSMSVVGQNLVKNRHPEYASPTISVEPDLMSRAEYAKITWSF